ncbi:MAG: hypothetical protein JW702_06670 [Clostridiales bacterium]|nr:hypothetical protein [Clostridiales bacterium]
MKHFRSFATNTRLMGVVAVKSYFTDDDENQYIVLLHLDYEGYGIDGIDYAMNIDRETEDYLSERVYGGLGGKLVEISFEDSSYLVSEAKKIGITNIDNDLIHWLDLYESSIMDNESAMKKVCKVIVSEYEAINYYLMRLIGSDFSGLAYLSNFESEHYYENEATLIKNSIKKISDGEYISTALILSGDYYSNERFFMKLENKTIKFSERINHMRVSHYEAAMQMKKEEYLTVYQVNSISDTLPIIAEKLRHVMINEYDRGVLMTHFFNHNHHVNNGVYYINGDVKANIYFTEIGQIIFASENKMDLDVVVELATSAIRNYNVVILGEFGYRNAVLLDFIQSEYSDFIEYALEELD